MTLLARLGFRSQPRMVPHDPLRVAIGHALRQHLRTDVLDGDTVTGPRVLAYGYRLGALRPQLYPLTTAIMRQAQAADLLAVIEHSVGVPWVGVHRDAGQFFYSVPNPRPFLVRATDFNGDGLEAAIGVDRMGRPVDVDLTRQPHVILAMPSGGGKTTAALAFVYRLAEQNAPDALRLIVVASDIPKWRPVEMLPHLWGIVHHNDGAPVLEWVTREVERREALGITSPRIVLVLDDAHALITRGGIAAQTMTNLSQQTRRAGVHMLITAHATNARNLGSADVEANIRRRFVAATSAGNAAQMTGRGGTGAHRLLGEGEAIDINNERETPVTLAVVAPDDFAALGARWGMGGVEPAPWAEAEKPKPTGTLIRPQFWQNAPLSASEAEPEAETEAETEAERVAPRRLTERERRVRDLLRERKTQAEILADVWNVTPGGGGAYKAACNEYRDVLARLVEVSA